MLVVILLGLRAVVSGDFGYASLFVAISRAVVHHDGDDGTASDPLVWSAGALPKRRRLGREERSTEVTDEDVGAWPYSVGLLVKFVAFLCTLHWPAAGDDLGRDGVSSVEMLLLSELWAGEGSSLKKLLHGVVGLGAQFQCQLFLLV